MYVCIHNSIHTLNSIETTKLFADKKKILHLYKLTKGVKNVKHKAQTAVMLFFCRCFFVFHLGI